MAAQHKVVMMDMEIKCSRKEKLGTCYTEVVETDIRGHQMQFMGLR